MKRILQHSPIPEKVYRSASFSPTSRMKIYQNETRLASLFNGYWISHSLSYRTPILSPCSRIVKAKAIIIKAKEEEVNGLLESALNKYEEGEIC